MYKAQQGFINMACGLWLFRVKWYRRPPGFAGLEALGGTDNELETGLVMLFRSCLGGSDM